MFDPDKMMQAIQDYQDIKARFSQRHGWRHYWRIFKTTNVGLFDQTYMVAAPETKPGATDVINEQDDGIITLQLNGHTIITGEPEEIKAFWQAVEG